MLGWNEGGDHHKGWDGAIGSEERSGILGQGMKRLLELLT